MVRLKKLPLYFAALVIISPYLARESVGVLLALCGYVLIDGRLEKNLCE